MYSKQHIANFQNFEIYRHYIEYALWNFLFVFLLNIMFTIHS